MNFFEMLSAPKALFASLFLGSERDRFARAIMHRAKERGWPHDIKYDRAQFSLHCGPGPDGATFNLANVFADWSRNTTESRLADVDRVVSAMFEGGSAWNLASALPQLLPTLRNRRELESIWMNPANKQEREWWDGAFMPLCGALAVVIAIDRPASLAMVDGRKLREWEASFTTLLERAILNLREKSPTLFQRDPDGFYFSQYNDQYDCSRLLIPELFDLLSLDGDPVAIPVARNGLVVAGSRDTTALCAMAHFVEEQLDAATRPIAYLPLVLREKSWSVFVPDSPNLEPVRDLVAKQKLWDYECQREDLQEFFTKDGRDIFVGKIIAKKFGGKIYSITTWAESVQTLLPEADAVTVIRADGRWVMRSWDDFTCVCAELLTDPGFYPARYMTPDWMNEPRFERLLKDFKAPAWLPDPVLGEGAMTVR
jgi:hypothetical protein